MLFGGTLVIHNNNNKDQYLFRRHVHHDRIIIQFILLESKISGILSSIPALEFT